MVKILSPLPTFFSTLPSLLMKDALSSALYVTLTVSYWILMIMISHKRYFLATHPKLQAIISKSLTHRLIISYQARDMTNHFLKLILPSVNLNLIYNFLIYIYIIVICYFILPGTFRYIGIWRLCNFVCLCFFCLYFTWSEV